MLFQERIDRRSRGDARLPSRFGRFEGGGCRCENNPVVQGEFFSEGRGVSAVKNIAATGGVHRIDFAGGPMPHLGGSMFPDIPATGAASGNDHGFTIRFPQGHSSARGIFFSGKFFSEALREEQMVHQTEQLLKLGSVSALEI